jgi:hypothetical protein
MTSTEAYIERFWDRVARASAPVTSGLGVLRVITGLYVLGFSAPYLSWVNGAPPAFYNPPLLSLGRLLPSFPPAWVTWSMDVVQLLAYAALALGIRARRTTLLLFGVGLLRQNVAYSFGKIDHDIMLYLLLGCMAFSGWGKRLALVPDAPSRWDAPDKALALLAVCFAFAMSSVGLQKGLNWLDFDTSTSGFLSWFVQGYFEYDRNALLAPHVLDMPPFALELVDYAGVVFESSCLFMLLRGRVAWRGWLVCACVFHLMNTLTLNIPFLENLLIYLAFVDFSAVERTLSRWGQRAYLRRLAVVAVASLPLLHLALRAAGRGSAFMFVIDKRRDSHVVLYAALACWSVALCMTLLELVRARRNSTAVA